MFDVYPFNDTLVTMTLTGAQILALLEQQWQREFPRVLHVSSGFTYAWNPGSPAGSRIVRDSVTIYGRKLDPDAQYQSRRSTAILRAGAIASRCCSPAPSARRA